ncbi:MAG TPA: SUMF1/EgtB/PvdO family nonheme iron enzyme [Pyrinomonadaceae bacterium]|nr:SUMF1/EgtB/PvdO family nonheme iron enzyme [Pyrinomonadaceae bacterium]
MVSPLNVQVYHVFLSSPGDMKEERDEVRSFFDMWNRENGHRMVRLDVLGDDTHGMAGVGAAQELITKQTLERFRSSLILFIGLMGQRFGTPTRNAGSGTEEEFKWALKHWQQLQRSGGSGEPFPEIKLFFRNRSFEAPLNVAAIEAALEQYRKVDAFKQRCRHGKPSFYYKEFDDKQFGEVFGADIRLWLSHPDRPWLKSVSSPVAAPARPRKIKPVQVTPEKSFNEPNTDTKMLWVPEGLFLLGEGRKVAVPINLSSFWIAETPVTNRQYGMFLKMQDPEYEEPEFWTDERYNDSQQPVVGVNWYNAMDFCSWLSTITGLKFSLCSEAQWEYAARGTDGRKYPWGNNPPTPRVARYERQYDRPASAGSYPYSRGPFGALEQAGNVWEWCLDVWNPKAYEQWRHAEPLDPMTTQGEVEDEDRRVLRGACWIDPPDLLLASTRYCQRASYTTKRAGFRVVVNLPDVK